MKQKIVRIHGMTFEEIFPAHVIADRVQSLAQEIISFHRNDPVASKDSEPIFIVVLNGATYFGLTFPGLCRILILIMKWM